MSEDVKKVKLCCCTLVGRADKLRINEIYFAASRIFSLALCGKLNDIFNCPVNDDGNLLFHQLLDRNE